MDRAYETRLAADRIRDDLDYVTAQLGKPEPVELMDFAAGYGRMRGTLISLRSSLGLVALELAAEPEPEPEPEPDYLAVYDQIDWENENYEPDETDLDAWENEGGLVLAS